MKYLLPMLLIAGCATGPLARTYHPLPNLLCEAMAEKNAEQRRTKLQRITNDYPNSPVAYFLIGQSLEKENRSRDALHFYERALEIQPSCVPCRIALGQIVIQGASTLNKNDIDKAKIFDSRSKS